MGTGEAAALAAAALWAFSSLLYAETRLTAWGMNLSKLMLAILLLTVQLAGIAVWNGTAFVSATPTAWGWLAISGLIGLTIGDTFYFRSLQILGARRCLVVTTSSPIFAAIAGWIWLNETLLLISIFGMITTLAGIIWVILDGDGKSEEPGHYPGSQKAGVAYGIASSVCQAVGGVATKIAMEDLSALEATFIRMLLAGGFTVIVVAWRNELWTTLKQTADLELLRRFLPAVICGTWLGVWFSQVAFKYTSHVGIAQTLLATCPLFAIPLVRWKYGTRITRPAIVGLLVALVGICLITLPANDRDSSGRPAALPRPTEARPATQAEIGNRPTPITNSL